MVALVIPDALQVTCGGFNSGIRWNNVFGVSNDGTFLMSSSVAAEIQIAFEDFYTALAPSLTGLWQYDECIVRDIRTETSGSYDVPPAAPVVGSNASEMMPPQMAIVATHATGLRGKSYRGRTYLAGWGEGSNTAAGQVAETTAATIEGAFDALRTDLAGVTGGPFDLSVLSRKLLLATPITGTSVDSEWDRQDRRKRSS